MAIKHIINYYNEICDQYKQMLDEIRDFEEEATKGLIEPERLDKIKEDIKPMKDNYERWSYMMYLLNLPTRKEKQKRYEQQNKKFLKAISDTNKVDATIEENNKSIESINSK